jgi:ATP-dependent RNA circularization protein (DNA/RNA ligase family)
MGDFSRFPHTPHLAWLASGSPRDDKVLAPAEVAALLATPVVLEEKLDGANLGFSVVPDGRVRAQNRGQFLEPPYHGQFALLGTWLAAHEDLLFDALGPDLIAFGEWCAARHSLDYDVLPDWWLLFDIYDRQVGAFWSIARRDAWARQNGFAVVPRLLQGRVSIGQLRQLVLESRSAFRDGPLEGMVIRREDERWLLDRAKLVRPDFTQAIDTHWRSRMLEWNRLGVEHS